MFSRSSIRINQICRHITPQSFNIQHNRAMTTSLKPTLLSSTSSPLLTTSSSPFTNIHAAEQSHTAWSSGASQYDTFFTPFFMEYAKQAIHHVKNKMLLSHESKILDVGAGTGAFALTAIQQGYQHVVAVDYAPDMITNLQTKRDQRGIPSSQLACHVMDGTKLTFADKTFDACFAMFCLMFFPDQLAGLKSMYRVLRGGGYVCVSAWAGMDKIEWVRKNNKAMLTVRPTLPRSPPLVDNLSNATRFSQLLKDAGFVDVEIVTIPQAFVIKDPGAFWICMAESFPAIRHILLTHFTPEERIRVQQQFIEIVTKEAKNGVVQLQGVALFGIGRRPE